MITRILALGAIGLAVLGGCGTAPATTIGPGPTDGVTRVELQRSPAPAQGFEIVQTRVEIPEGKESGRHSHPGPEVGYIVQGDVVIEFADREPLRLRTGDPFLIPAGVVHNARNVGTVRTQMLSTYVIDQAKPLVTRH
ncbi:cupin domain-containing protein [Crossiella sp. CA-258035]|uniref:cupin domain-containing protein n=1 Tax=Crossiella sp. CA-258035 TaxID=2981138 RepID=UPI0024BC278D|nr:cupin domain-containing protein [Crossiella sp. CA-258035]WHT23080.1 cupin domain-containing protein [Crossiella sp. CA-258035]